MSYSEIFNSLPKFQDIVDLKDHLQDLISKKLLPPAKVAIDRKADLFIGTDHEGAWIGRKGSHVRAIKEACSTPYMRINVCEPNKAEEIIDLKENYVSVQEVFILRLGVTYQYNYDFLNPEGVNIDRNYVYLAKDLRLKDMYLRDLHFDLDYSLFIHRDDIDEFVNRYNGYRLLSLKSHGFIALIKKDHEAINEDPSSYFKITEEDLNKYDLTVEELLLVIDYFNALEEKYWKA